LFTPSPIAATMPYNAPSMTYGRDPSPPAEDL